MLSLSLSLTMHSYLFMYVCEDRRQTGGVLVSYMPSLDDVTQLILAGELDAVSAKEVHTSADS